MQTKTIKTNLFTCQLPSNFKKNLVGAYTTPFSFSPIPERYRQEFWFGLEHRNSIGKRNDFTTDFAAFVQEGFSAKFTSKTITINGNEALQITYPETKQIPTENGFKTYHLTNQAVAVFLNKKHCFVALFSYDTAEKTKAIENLKVCLNSLEILGDTNSWEAQIQKEKAEDDAYWAKQEHKKQLKARQNRKINHPVLGNLTHVANPNLTLEEDTFWEAKLSIKAKQITFNLNLGTSDKHEQKALSLANQIIQNFELHFSQAQQAITAEFLELYNSSWRQEGDAILNEVEFKNRINLTTIEVLEDLDCNFWFNDDDMFGGHGLLVNTEIDQNNTWTNISAEMFG